MKLKPEIWITMVIALFSNMQIQSQVLGIYEFNTGADCATIDMDVTSQPANASLSTLTKSTSPTCEDNALEYLSNSWAQGAENLENYHLTFTAAADAAYQINATEISFDIKRGTQGPEKGKVYSSLNGGPWTLEGAEFIITTTMQNIVVPLVLNTSNGGNIAFRITTYDAPNSGNPAKMWIDNITLTGAAPLPIELVAFTAQLVNNEVVLNWTTATEEGNDFFTVERSADGTQFEEIMEVEGAGFSSTENNYEAVDDNPLEGTSYYRLKQTDFNGRFEYAQTVMITNWPTTAEASFTVFPNPTSASNINVSVQDHAPNEEILVVLADINGKVFYSKVVMTDNNGAVLVAVDPYSNIPPGQYSIIGTSENTIYSKRLIIL